MPNLLSRMHLGLSRIILAAVGAQGLFRRVAPDLAQASTSVRYTGTTAKGA